LTDTELQRRIFRFFAEERRAPDPAEVGADAADYRRLAESHALALRADGGIRIANPFSGVPTGHTAEVAGRSWDASCVWDGLGILAALGADGVLRTSCSDCGRELTVEVRGRELAPTDGVAHFLLPAARWYDDLVHT
jgi:Alkylmercury lyase